MEKNTTVFLLSVCFILAIVEANENCFENINNFHCFLNSKTPYRFVANYNTSSLYYPGCKEQKFWMIARHGTRFPEKKSGLKMKGWLEEFRDDIISSYKFNNSKLTREIIEKLKNWTFDFEKSESMVLKPEGFRELQGLGSRFKARFPNIFAEYNADNHKFQFTDTQRTKYSAKAFTNGIFGNKSKNVIYEDAVKHDRLLRFEDFCHRWKREVHNNPEAKKEKKLFSKSKIFEEAVESISELIGFEIPSGILSEMYSMCTLETAWNHQPSRSVWCEFFTLEQLKVLQYKEDLEYYYDDGYGYPINYQQACPLMVDVFNFFESNENSSVTGYFSHSPILLKFLSLVGIAKDDEPLRHDNFSLKDNSKKWKSSLVDAFATNVAFILYDCEDQGKAVITMHQERVFTPPGCPHDKPCPIEVIKEIYADPIKNCDFEKICE